MTSGSYEMCKFIQQIFMECQPYGLHLGIWEWKNLWEEEIN